MGRLSRSTRRPIAVVVLAALLLTLQACSSLKSGNDACRGDSAETWRQCGDAAREKGDYARAVVAYDKALALEPDSEPALTDRGFSYHALQDYDAAIQDFTAVIRLRPDALSVYVSRSASFFRKGDLDAAIGDLRECLRREPTYADAYYDLGYYQWKSDRFDEALASFNEAIRYYAEAASHPPSPRVSGWFNDDRFYARKPESGVALRNIDAYLADAYYWRAQTYLSLGERKKADADLTTAHEIDRDAEWRNERIR
jgi:tetratricopeptide (TPR) repeat protein